MSEPIRTVEEFADVFGEMETRSIRAIQGAYGAGLSKIDEKAQAEMAFHHANRILDYLGLDYCEPGETPRERIERERKGYRHPARSAGRREAQGRGCREPHR